MLDQMKKVRDEALRNIETNKKLSEEEKKVLRFQTKWEFFKSYDQF